MIEPPSPVDIEAERRVVAALNAPAPLDGAHKDVEGLDISRMYGNTTLFGHDPMEGIVSVEFTDPNLIIVYRRDAAGAMLQQTTRLKPFLWDQNGDCFFDATQALRYLARDAVCL